MEKTEGNPFWMVLLFVALGLLYLQDYIKTKYSRRARLANAIPGADLPIVPFIGNVALFGLSPNLKEAFTAYVEKYGRTCRMWNFHLPTILVAESKTAEAILLNPDLYEKGEDNWAVKEILGNGLVAGSGAKVRHERKILNPAFNRQLFDGFLQVFNNESREFVNICNGKFQHSTEAINLHPNILKCSLECVFQTSLGKEMHIQTSIGDKFVEAFAIGSEGMHIRFFKPWLNLPIVRDILGIRQREENALGFIKKTILAVLEERKEMRNKDPNANHLKEKTKPFIDVLLDAGDGINENEYYDHLITIVGAGSDTIANAVNFTLFLMALHPEYQSRVHEELDAIFWGDMDSDVTTEDLAEARYLEMCLKESMRIFPPIPLMSRKLLFDLKLENGMILPEGSDAVFLIYDIHRDPAVFPNAEVYDPERFAPDVNRSQGCYIPFGMGLRNCIGQRFAMMESKVTLAHILRHFQVTSPQNREDIKFLYGLPVEPHPAIKLHLKPRLHIKQL